MSIGGTCCRSDDDLRARQSDLGTIILRACFSWRLRQVQQQASLDEVCPGDEQEPAESARLSRYVHRSAHEPERLSFGSTLKDQLLWATEHASMQFSCRSESHVTKEVYQALMGWCPAGHCYRGICACQVWPAK